MKKSNRLLQGLIILSLGIHFIFYLNFADIFKSKASTYIELIMQDLKKPETRSIPRPRPRHKTPDIPQEVNKIHISQPVQPVKQIKVDPVTDNYKESLMEGISVPAVDTDITGDIGNYNVTDLIGNNMEFGTEKDYLEMVMLKIESVKKYPDQAREMQKEGHITVGFTVTMAGAVKDIRVIEPSRHEILNKAAVDAVLNASPFPKPPKRFFGGDVLFEIKVIFETT